MASDAGQCSRRWAHRCAHSKGRRCKCSCGGANHGRSNPLSAAHQPTQRELRARRQFDMFGELDARRNGDALFYPTAHAPERLALDRLEHPDARVIWFRRFNDMPSIWIHEPDRGDDQQLDRELEQRIVYHSPTGLEFGYGGSGPADAAINILALVLPPREAVRLHHLFKDEFIADVPRAGGELRMAEVRKWIAVYYRAELDDAPLMAREREQRELLAEIDRLDAEEASAASEALS